MLVSVLIRILISKLVSMLASVNRAIVYLRSSCSYSESEDESVAHSHFTRDRAWNTRAISNQRTMHLTRDSYPAPAVRLAKPLDRIDVRRSVEMSPGDAALQYRLYQECINLLRMSYYR